MGQEWNRELIEQRSVSLYPRHWSIVENYAAELEEPNVSGALRKIINEWAQFKRTQMPLPMGTAQS